MLPSRGGTIRFFSTRRCAVTGRVTSLRTPAGELQTGIAAGNQYFACRGRVARPLLQQSSLHQPWGMLNSLIPQWGRFLFPARPTRRCRAAAMPEIYLGCRWRTFGFSTSQHQSSFTSAPAGIFPRSRVFRRRGFGEKLDVLEYPTERTNQNMCVIMIPGPFQLPTSKAHIAAWERRF